MAASDDLISALRKRGYPGRGLALGVDSAGVSFAAYWVTGRSRASQLRRFVVGEASVSVVDTSDGPADALRHYTAVRVEQDHLLIGNGDQIDQLAAARRGGVPVEVELNRLAFEPDPPIRTPRISGYAQFDSTSRLSNIVVSGARSNPGDPENTQRLTLQLDHLVEGQCLVAMTYKGSRDAPTADGVPGLARVNGPWESLATTLWSALDRDLRVGALVFPLASLSSIEMR